MGYFTLLRNRYTKCSYPVAVGFNRLSVWITWIRSIQWSERSLMWLMKNYIPLHWTADVALYVGNILQAYTPTVDQSVPMLSWNCSTGAEVNDSPAPSTTSASMESWAQAFSRSAFFFQGQFNSCGPGVFHEQARISKTYRESGFGFSGAKIKQSCD